MYTSPHSNGNYYILSKSLCKYKRKCDAQNNECFLFNVSSFNGRQKENTVYVPYLQKSFMVYKKEKINNGTFL